MAAQSPLTEHAQNSITLGAALARKNSSPELTPAHIVFSMLEANEEIVKRALEVTKLPLSNFRAEVQLVLEALPRVKGQTSEPAPGSHFNYFLDDAISLQKVFQDDYVSVEHCAP